MPAVLIRSIATVLFGVGTSFLLPIFVAWWHGELRHIQDFALPLLACWILAVLFWFRGRGKGGLGGVQNAFVIVGCAWVAISVFGAFPLYNCGGFPSFVDALFESVSGFTTTGASVLGDVESLPRCINFWRCQTHWLGGMGVIALAVALIPLLGVGGYRLIQAETSGPEKGKLTARISNTAKILWMIYFVLTASQAALLHWSGMDWFDAVCHAMSTLGTGGFSTRNASLSSFANPTAEWICTVFMLAASVNFGLYYQFLIGRWSEVRDNTELRGFVFVVAAVVLGVTALEWTHFGTLATAFRHSAFQVASIITTTGFATTDFNQWPEASKTILVMLMFVGACAGSTGGGIKVSRFLISIQSVLSELHSYIHPKAITTVKMDKKPIDREVVRATNVYFITFLLVFATSVFIISLEGHDLITNFTAVAATINNIGPGLSQVGPAANFNFFSHFSKYVLMFDMLAGRLEFFPLLILLHPTVWKDFATRKKKRTTL